MKRFFALLFLLLGLVAFSYAEKPQGEAPLSKSNLVLFITLEATINPGTADYIDRAIQEAVTKNAQALVIELDTPGGLLDSTRTIVKSLLNADIPVVVFVGPRGARAGSAGVFITLAGHVAAMAPGTNIGAAHPITGSGKDPEEEGGKHMAQKIENDTAAFIETIANQRARNVEWARKAVLESVSVTEKKALELKVIDIIAEDRGDLLKKIDGLVIKLPNRNVTLATKDAQIENLDMSWKQSFVNLFSNPNIIYFLILIATLGIYLELSHPGAILPGVSAALAIILILISAQTLPFNTAGILLMILGAVFFVLEMYVTSFGLLTLGGIACFIVGSLLLFDPQHVSGFLGVSRLLVYSTGIVLGGLFGMLGYFIARTHMRPVSTGNEGILGKTGVAVSNISPTGKVLLEGEYWEAQSDSNISKGATVKVVKIEGLTLKVVTT